MSGKEQLPALTASMATWWPWHPGPNKGGPHRAQNAASIAGLIITTEAMVGEPPKKDSSTSGNGHGSGLGSIEL